MKKKGLLISLSVMIALVLIITATVVTLVACGKKEEPTTVTTVETTTAETTTAAPTTTETTTTVETTTEETTTEETTTEETTTEKVYDDVKLQYLSKVTDTDSMILVIGDGSVSGATFYYCEKTGDEWEILYNCYAVVGQNGFSDHTYEGDRTTPTGCFDMGIAFGIMDNPGTALDWVDVNEYLYWVADPSDPNYEQLVDVREVEYTWNDSEHLIDFWGYYNYSVHIKVNPPYTTSAIFLHCSCGGNYTGGCVGIDEDSMIWTLRTMTKDTKITMVEYEDDLWGLMN